MDKRELLREMVDVVYVEVTFIGLGRDLPPFAVFLENLDEASHTCTAHMRAHTQSQLRLLLIRY